MGGEARPLLSLFSVISVPSLFLPLCTHRTACQILRLAVLISICMYVCMDVRTYVCGIYDMPSIFVFNFLKDYFKNVFHQ